MVSFFDLFNPSFLLFPALLGSAILALVCPLVGAHLMLRRRIFLGLTLPQIAACGVAFTFWLSHAAGVTHGTGGERLLATAGSLVFTLAGLGLLAYLDRHAAGSPEGRLAAAYALASALTILFVVFNPAGELEILNLLKGEVISLSPGDLKLLALIYGAVYFGLVLFRREFLLDSFDRDLSFLLTGGSVQWSVWLYVLCGFSIAVGVIMAGPLMVFGFMVLPPLAARSLAPGMNAFLWLSSLVGLFVAVFGFYLSVRLDWPLGPTDVAFGCAVIFALYALRFMIRKSRESTSLWIALMLLGMGCSPRSPTPRLQVQLLREDTVWLAEVRNSTGSELRLPAANPLHSLAEMAGKTPPVRPTVPALLREALQAELESRKIKAALPESYDARLRTFSPQPESAALASREAKMAGLLLLTDIQRWHAGGGQLLSARVHFKLLRISDGALVWEREIRRVLSTAGAAHLGQASGDMIGEILRELLGS